MSLGKVRNDEPIWIGRKFGRLTVRGFIKLQNCVRWECDCDCGKRVVVRAYDVKSGKTTSCGCYHDEVCRKKAMTHNNLVKENDRLYGIYNGMKRRCYNQKEPRYKDYGGRGIKICDEWLDRVNGFDNFYYWAIKNGYTEELTIDRIDPDGDYEPSNCRWLTKKDQNQNKRVTIWVDFFGEHIQLRVLCDRNDPRVKVSYDTAHDRIFKRGWDVEKALTTPSEREHKSFAQKCREHGINPITARDRIIKLGWSEEDALNIPCVGRGARGGTYNRQKF